MNEFKVGLLTLMTMASIVYMSLKVTSNQSGFGEYVPYRTMIGDASGIFPKTPIKVAGINAGRITSIELQGNQALISFEVLSRVKITVGSRLKIKTVGFLGDKYLEIIVSPNEKRLAEHEFIESETGGGLEDLTKDASQVLKDVKDIVTSMKESIAPKDQEAPLTRIMRDFQEVSANMKEATKSLRKILVGNEQKIDNLLTNFEELSQSLAHQSDVQKRDSIMSDLKKITEDLRTLVSDVRAGKGTIGKLLVEDQIADSVSETLSGVQKIVSKVDTLRTEFDVFTGYDNYRGGKTQVDLLIYPSPERFYTLGVVSTRFSPIQERRFERNINGVQQDEIVRYYERYKPGFTIQFGRKIHQWSLRGGVLESRGGFGGDFDWEKMGTRFSADVFDLRDDLGLNFRLATEIHVWNVLYGKVTANDILTQFRSYTISAGLRFNDEDMKGILGFFF